MELDLRPAKARHGKAWLALQAAIDAHDVGCRVLWIDAEDSDMTCAQRLRALTAEDLLTSPTFRWLDFEQWNDSPGSIRQALAAWADSGPAGGFVVIDAATSSGAGHSFESFEAWADSMLGPIPKTCGVFVVDHTGSGSPTKPAPAWRPDRIGREGRSSDRGAAVRLGQIVDRLMCPPFIGLGL